MQFSKDRNAADLLVLPFWEGKKQAEKAFKFSEIEKVFEQPLQMGDFKGKEGETFLLYSPQKIKEKRILLLGLGVKEKVSLEICRCAYAAIIKMTHQKKWESINIIVPDLHEVFEGVCEGLLLANYAFDKMKKDTVTLLKKISLIGSDAKALTLCERLDVIVNAVNFARDLVNSNADEVTPQRLSVIAKELQKDFSKIKTTVFGKKEIEKHKMGLLLAVSRASMHDPALIVMEYRGNPVSKQKTAIVGKGITYDTGGLNIKPTGGIETMKCDMAGAAAVLGTMRAAAELKLKSNLIGVVAATENAVGPEAYKPGDVYISYSGKSVEITNTDAEGRLVLADALSYTVEHLKPTRIIDLATLTGSCVIALGEEVAGLFSNDDTLAQELLEAGEKTFERLWRMPIYREYRDQLKSSIADIKNAGSRKGGASVAACFLQEFVNDIPWAHLDIAGTAYLSDIKSYHPTHATGMGIRLLIEYLYRKTDS